MCRCDVYDDFLNTRCYVMSCRHLRVLRNKQGTRPPDSIAVKVGDVTQRDTVDIGEATLRILWAAGQGW